MASYDDETEAPLDPAAERLRRKLARLLLISGGIMALGLIAVFAAIVYRLGALGPVAGETAQTSGPSAGAPIEARIALPAGARLLESELDGDRALLTVGEAGGGTSLLLVDLATGAVIGRYAVADQ